jgi:hypothetical protein
MTLDPDEFVIPTDHGLMKLQRGSCKARKRTTIVR